MDQLNFSRVAQFFQYSVRVCLPERPGPMMQQTWVLTICLFELYFSRTADTPHNQSERGVFESVVS